MNMLLLATISPSKIVFLILAVGLALSFEFLNGSNARNGLAVALRELGRVERTLVTLEGLQNTELRPRVQEC